MKRAKLNNDKITALYCRLSKDDGMNNGRPLSRKAQADMTTSSEGLSSAPIVGVPCLPKSSRKESGTMY